MNKIPKAGEDAAAFLRSILPADDERVKTRPMFGNPAAFVNGNLFAGLFGEDLFVRLSERDAQALLRIKGTAPFAPMEGGTMKGYVVIPKTWKNDPAAVEPWIVKSIDYVATLPPKKKNNNKKSPK